MARMDYSVLMSVYHKERPEFLRQAMESIATQTVPTNDFVLVCDGPLNEQLDEVIVQMQNVFGQLLHVVRLEKNMGLGNALNIGIQHCKNDLVARMDSDDISRPDRCERQLKIFEERPEFDICSGTVEEFTVQPQDVENKRVVPRTHEEILKFAKKRNPFNHPCVMYRKSAVLAAGSYQDFYLLEDYYLWIRMLLNGSVGYNVQEPLLWMRAGSDMYKRRSGWRYARSQYKLFWFMETEDFISKVSCICSCVSRMLAALLPNFLRKNMYAVALRRNSKEEQ